MALPTAFLPFDPNRDYDGSDNEDDEPSSESDDESNRDPLHDSINNGDNNHERKHKRHIGGGVILVSEFLC